MTKPLSARGIELDTLSRSRALTYAESLELEREIILAEGQKLPEGLTRELARHGVRRIDGRTRRKPTPDKGASSHHQEIGQ